MSTGMKCMFLSTVWFNPTQPNREICVFDVNKKNLTQTNKQMISTQICWHSFGVKCCTNLTYWVFVITLISIVIGVTTVLLQMFIVYFDILVLVCWLVDIVVISYKRIFWCKILNSKMSYISNHIIFCQTMRRLPNWE